MSTVPKLTCMKVINSNIAMGGSMTNEFRVFNTASIMEYAITHPKGTNMSSDQIL